MALQTREHQLRDLPLILDPRYLRDLTIATRSDELVPSDRYSRAGATAPACHYDTFHTRIGVYFKGSGDRAASAALLALQALASRVARLASLAQSLRAQAPWTPPLCPADRWMRVHIFQPTAAGDTELR